MATTPPTPGTDDARTDRGTDSTPTPPDHTTCPARADATDLPTAKLTLDETTVSDRHHWR